MSLDVSLKLIVGVPLLELGEIQETRADLPLTDCLGQPTGKVFPSQRLYLHSHNQDIFFIGTNEYNAPYTTIDYTYSNLFDDEEATDCEWFHYSDHNDYSPRQVVIGLAVPTTYNKQSPYVCRDYSCRSDLSTIESTIPRVREFLVTRFGYTGEIYTIALATYS